MRKTALIAIRNVSQMQALWIDNHHIAPIPTKVESCNVRRGPDFEREFSINGTSVNFPQAESLLLASIGQHFIVRVERHSKTSSGDKQELAIARLPEPGAAVPRVRNQQLSPVIESQVRHQFGVTAQCA